jgi:hypothetical protein
MLICFLHSGNGTNLAKWIALRLDNLECAQIGWSTYSEPSGQRLPEQGQNQIGKTMPDRRAIWQSTICQIAFFKLATQETQEPIWQSGNLENQSGQITFAWPV